jgi:hypothetical protein
VGSIPTLGTKLFHLKIGGIAMKFNDDLKIEVNVDKIAIIVTIAIWIAGVVLVCLNANVINLL